MIGLFSLLLDKLKNDRGLGVVWNNIGLTIKELTKGQDTLEEAEKY